MERKNPQILFAKIGKNPQIFVDHTRFTSRAAKHVPRSGRVCQSATIVITRMQPQVRRVRVNFSYNASASVVRQNFWLCPNEM